MARVPNLSNLASFHLSAGTWIDTRGGATATPLALLREVVGSRNSVADRL